MSIPKIIHYCWFGGNPLPDAAKKCIESWKTFFPEYEIREWTEENFDVNICTYTAEAYKEKRWAFVSDYARFWILYNYGGLYFDTDVEVIRPMDDVISNGCYMGCEYGKSEDQILVNPGLGMAALPGLSFFKIVLEYYDKLHFNVFDMITICEYTTNLLKEYGFHYDGTIQERAKINIYPIEYFCPINYCTGEMNISPNTRTIHHYFATWITEKEKKAKKIQKKLEKILNIPLSKNIFFSIWKNLYCYGVKGFVRKYKEKYGK